MDRKHTRYAIYARLSKEGDEQRARDRQRQTVEAYNPASLLN